VGGKVDPGKEQEERWEVKYRWGREVKKIKKWEMGREVEVGRLNKFSGLASVPCRSLYPGSNLIPIVIQNQEANFVRSGSWLRADNAEHYNIDNLCQQNKGTTTCLAYKNSKFFLFNLHRRLIIGGTGNVYI
jgi:hypothetical protein